MRIADLRIEAEQGILVARLNGEVDMSNAGELSREIRRQVTNEALGVVLDLTDVAYLDSAGIQLLFELRERLAARGQEMRLVVPADSPVSQTLAIVDAARAFGVVEDRDAALAEVAAAVPRVGESGDPGGKH